MNAGWGLCCCRSCCCSVAWLGVLCRRSSSSSPKSPISCRVFSRIDQLEDHFRCVAIRVSFLLLLIPLNRLMGLCSELLFSRSLGFVVMGLGTRTKLLLSLLLWWVLLSSLVLIASFFPCFPDSIKIQSGVVRQKLWDLQKWLLLWMSGWVYVRSSRDAGRMGVGFFLWKIWSLGILMLKNLSSKVLGLVLG